MDISEPIKLGTAIKKNKKKQRKKHPKKERIINIKKGEILRMIRFLICEAIKNRIKKDSSFGGRSPSKLEWHLFLALARFFMCFSIKNRRTHRVRADGRSLSELERHFYLKKRKNPVSRV